ncbi:MAG: VCBS repeat-containing protein [candidate division Zixibacteria bacterium]|nr:VCBS repeat-containing protein [candidate division Zixibacteria bacterium]
MKHFILLMGFLLLIPFAGTTASDFNFAHAWTAMDVSYPTGLGWADFDDNGWMDLYVANGLDVYSRANTIYFNGPDSLSRSAGYFSTELDPSCQISIGDLDNDGDPDVVVSSLGFTPQGCPPYMQLIYYHNDGVLDPTYTWAYGQSNGFSNALGDYDGDGDLDIVFTLGDYYTNHPQKAVIIENIEGEMATFPVWYQNVASVSSDAAFVDIDLDGDLDLTLTGDAMNLTVAGAVIHYNNDGVIETTPSWLSQNITGGPQLDYGDVNGDGYPDLAIAGGGLTGGFLCLFINFDGVLETTPSWIVHNYLGPCCVAWGDLDGDGDLDLVAGSWYEPVVVFINEEGCLSDTAVYEIPSSGATQMISLNDYDEDYLIDTFKTVIGDGSRKLFPLKEKPIHKISSVSLNGVPLDLDQYCYELEKGWVSLGFAPALNDTLRINYIYSLDLDIAISGSGGCNIFENKTRELIFCYPKGLPLTVTRGLQTEIEVVAEGSGIGIPLPGTGQLHYSLNGEPYVTVEMTAIGESHYLAVLPAVTDCADELRYCFSALEIKGRRFFSVDTTSPYTPPIVTQSDIAFEDNFLKNKYWGVTGDAVEGDWERGQPAGDGSDGAPTGDYDGTGYCFLTGNTPGSDVDNGFTKMISPTFIMSDSGATFISYAFWFNNNCGGNPDDYFRAYISNDLGVNWVLIDDIDGTDEEASGGWNVHTFYAEDYVSPSNKMKLMFETADVNQQSCVEVAVDDIRVTTYYCRPGCCIGDVGNVNCSEEETPDISDITRLIDYLYISHAPLCCPAEADANISGGEPDIADITRLIDFLYISHAPVAPCP